MLGRLGMYIQNHNGRFDTVLVMLCGIASMMTGFAGWIGGLNFGASMIAGGPVDIPVGSHSVPAVLLFAFGTVLVVGGAIRLRKKE